MHPGKDPEQQSIGEILSSLKVKQLWALGGAVVVLLAGTFAFGAWTNRQIMEVDLNLAKTEKVQLQGQIDLLRIKEKILAQIALYHGYKSRAFRPDATTEEHARFRKQSDELSRTVKGYARDTLKGESKPSIRIRIGKGTQPSVVFEFDQSSFPLPPELFAVAR